MADKQLKELKDIQNSIQKNENKLNLSLQRMGTLEKQNEKIDKLTENVFTLTSTLELYVKETYHMWERMDTRMKNHEERQIKLDENLHINKENIIKLQYAPGEKAKTWWDRIFYQAVISLVSAGIGGLLIYVIAKGG